ncbi:MAG TPA: CBS domain-containing protein [Nitrosopumilaceae archaeon]|nr:CBS domain-containing protein [Nitrosopumilaceae archaeon]
MMSRDDFNNNSVLVRDIMNKTLISVNPTTTSFQIAKMMKHGGIGTIIVKEKEIPAGIITDRDFATKITAYNLPFDTPAEKIMSFPLITIDHADPISSAAQMMSSKKIRKLVVVAKDKIVGIITSTDLVNQLAK